MILNIILGLANKFGNLFVFAFILSRLRSFRNLIAKRPVKLIDKLILSSVFGIFGIIGTYFSIEFEGALVNTRIIGVATGGLLGGPLVGLLAGLIAGIHRGMIFAGSFTTTACAVSTVFEGIMAGFMGKFIQNKKKKWMYAALTGAIAESMRKISVLIFSRPFEDAVSLVKAIWIPMVVINSLGLALLFVIIDNIFTEEEKMGAQQAELTLRIADKTLPFIKKGLSSKDIQKVAQIVYDMTEYNAVSFTNTEKIVAHAGAGTDRHEVGKPIVTDITNHVLATGEPIILGHCSEKLCMYRNHNCPLESVVMFPLKENDKVIGTFKLYKGVPNAITAIDVELANGLAKLFSTQLTLGKLEYHSKLLAAAELKALQAQINPHFLFNSLTVIGSLCRTNPDKARSLITHLSNVFRKNLNMNKEVIDLEVELNHVKSYVEIEKARFEEKLEVIYDIEENLNCILPPLTLQPIVENAIKHGLLPKKNGGRVSITGKKQKNEVIIHIEDDGVGIEKERLLQIMSDKQIHEDSLGINNVNQRLKGMFGEKYGLQIESKVGKGTVVVLKIPVIEHAEECD
ncbi:LytS/YhcK type 5TM receptor domain-containing protein [Crassaminicella indica]|uniref:Histidine kinase n=1 Tax=Crassaminicella indica TaxID=2855394 RepID=A0ABX8RBV9_9CLOT|nr:LytS/YhcK type 5TM receptor domain-containing protein [Crassaminicella indica]QXM05200.1 histidine kinase [Crassaminicella indica]